MERRKDREMERWRDGLNMEGDYGSDVQETACLYLILCAVNNFQVRNNAKVRNNSAL